MHGPLSNHRLRGAIARELLDEREASEVLAPAAATLPSTRVVDDAEDADAADRSDDVEILTGGADYSP